MKTAPQLKAITGTIQVPDGAKIKLSTWAWHHPGAADATESTMAATESTKTSSFKCFNKGEISYLDEQ